MNRNTAASALALSLAFLAAAPTFADDDAPPARPHIVTVQPGDNIDRLMAAEQNGPVFVFVKASWCGWCHQMEPILKEAFSERYPDGMATLLIVDADQHPELRGPVPQLFGFRGTALKAKMVGVPDDAIFENRIVSGLFKQDLLDFFNETNVHLAPQYRHLKK